jgi:hypothetical protein
MSHSFPLQVVGCSGQERVGCGGTDELELTLVCEDVNSNCARYRSLSDERWNRLQRFAAMPAERKGPGLG